MWWFGVVFFFFFKQKTAYEMRISDWMSDVCSSDLWSCSSIPMPMCCRSTTPRASMSPPGSTGYWATRPDEVPPACWRELGRIDIQPWRPANGGFPRFRCSRAVSTLRSGSRKTTIFGSPSSECRSVPAHPRPRHRPAEDGDATFHRQLVAFGAKMRPVIAPVLGAVALTAPARPVGDEVPVDPKADDHAHALALVGIALVALSPRGLVDQIGKASCRGRVYQYGLDTGGGGRI